MPRQSSSKISDAPEVTVQSPLAYSIPELVRVTGLSRTLLYSEMKRGNLRARKVGTRTIVTYEDATAFLKGLRDAG